MNKELLIIPLALLYFFLQYSCNTANSTSYSDIARDSATIERDKTAFQKNCSNCHSFRYESIGPQLGGITTQVSRDWLYHFIKDPRKMIESGDGRSKALQHKYKSVMPTLAISDEEIGEIISYLHTRQKPVVKKNSDGKQGIEDPIPDTIQMSDLVVDLEFVKQIPSSSINGKKPLARINKLSFAQNVNGLFIVDLHGKLYKLKNNQLSIYMDLPQLSPHFISDPGQGTGFGSFVFHPNFSKNGLLYTTHTESAGSGNADFRLPDSIKVALQWVLTEWKANNPAADQFQGTHRELLRADMPSVMHGFQELEFNSNAKKGSKDYGKLYLGIGDGGSVDVGFSFLPHSPERILGSIIRVDPAGSNSKNGRYGIPSDNPSISYKGEPLLKEVYAYGFRNPHRISWNKAGQMIVSNIGQSKIESVNIVLPGNDFGWPFREGSFLLDPDGDVEKVYPLPANDSIYHFSYPIAQYDHKGKGYSAISGGYQYSGSAVPALKGKYFFGDIHSGKLYYIDMSEVKEDSRTGIKEWQVSFDGKKTTLSTLCEQERTDLRFGIDAEGEIYIMTKTDGNIYKMNKVLSK